MDTHQWLDQDIEVGAVKGANMEEKNAINRTQKPQAINCPRCNSSHTKFCYYNNYSLTQPRYFCKSCRRYWTEGGSLRNVPVGGSSRRNNNNNNKRSSSSSYSSSSSSSSSSLKKLTIPSDHHDQMTRIFSHNINLSYPSAPIGNNYNSAISLFVEDYRNNYQQHPNTTLMSLPVSDSTHIYASPVVFQDFKPTLNFSFEGGGFESLHDRDCHNNGTAGARMFFPYADLKVSTTGTTRIEEGNNMINNRGNVGDDSGNGYWSGSLGAGSW